MSLQESAAEHLRIIRTLLERAQIYRAISAPAALVGGILALVMSLLMGRNPDLTNQKFLFGWLVLLLIVTKLNLLLLWRGALVRSQKMLSPEFWLAIKAMLPSMASAGILGIAVIVSESNLPIGALVWITGYGCALLTTRSFSPRSIKRLGIAFVGLGIVFTLWWASKGAWEHSYTAAQFASLLMGSSFGILHIAYAAAVFLNPQKQEPVNA